MRNSPFLFRCSQYSRCIRKSYSGNKTLISVLIPFTNRLNDIDFCFFEAIQLILLIKNSLLNKLKSQYLGIFFRFYNCSKCIIIRRSRYLNIFRFPSTGYSAYPACFINVAESMISLIPAFFILSCSANISLYLKLCGARTTLQFFYQHSEQSHLLHLPTLPSLLLVLL